MADERAPRQSGDASLRTARRLCGTSRRRASRRAALGLDLVSGYWTISAVHLALSGRVPNIDGAKLDDIAADAKANCPVSRLLTADITLEAKLAS